MNALRQQDKNLREALRLEEAQLPQMPDDLNARLLQRLPKRPRTMWRWMAAAACLLLLIGIGFTLLPKEPQTEPLVAQQTVQPQTEEPKAAPTPQEEPQAETLNPPPTDSKPKARKRRTKASRKMQPQTIAVTQEPAPTGTPELIPDPMPDPFLMAEMHAQQIHARGMRLYQEIEQQIKN